jgi:hypothetical protein
MQIWFKMDLIQSHLRTFFQIFSIVFPFLLIELKHRVSLTLYSPIETLVEFDFGCKSMFVTCKIEFYAAAIILLINANEGCQFGVRNVSFRQGCYR